LQSIDAITKLSEKKSEMFNMIEMVFESFVSVNCEIGRNDGEPRARFEAPGLASWFSREAIAKFLSQNVRNQTRESLAEANSFLMYS